MCGPTKHRKYSHKIAKQMLYQQKNISKYAVFTSGNLPKRFECGLSAQDGSVAAVNQQNC